MTRTPNTLDIAVEAERLGSLLSAAFLDVVAGDIERDLMSDGHRTEDYRQGVEDATEEFCERLHRMGMAEVDSGVSS